MNEYSLSSAVSETHHVHVSSISSPLFTERSAPPGALALGPYAVRFARNERDKKAVAHLKRDLSQHQIDEARSGCFAIDSDDALVDACAHDVLVHHQATGELVATVALKTVESNNPSDFLTQTKFALSALPERVIQRGAEVGRAYVAHGHRNAAVVKLLWHGITRYLDWNDKRYVFSFGSLPTHDPNAIAAVSLKLVREGRFHRTVHVPVHLHARVSHPRKVLAKEQASLPPLFESHLKLGAKVVGGPAIDRDCGLTDYLLLLDLRDIEPHTLASLCAPGLFRSDTRKPA